MGGLEGLREGEREEGRVEERKDTDGRDGGMRHRRTVRGLAWVASWMDVGSVGWRKGS